MDIVWRVKPIYDTDTSVYTILNYRSNEEEVFYNVKENDIQNFINLLQDNRKLINIYNDIRTSLNSQNHKYVLKFKDNKSINKIVFLPNNVLIIFEEIELPKIDKYLLIIYNLFLSKIYYKKSVNVKIVVISTKLI